ncbi:biliverdin-producing heme oxygenase [uncultured Azohydromonas sp.]|jgi:Heme oxygenase|uniref:biliverdin-producing heme oxygenase n=1 Tax=uncultured Azohydromonas sp. TaxID=487342 RepID=UPI0026264D7C|nr:biliverdin-producing heme oxygenase [uncultured Azohydromonas sp.]
MSDESTTVLGALRQACAERHQAIEALLKLDQALDREHYARVLTGFGAFVPYWEARLRPRLPWRLQGWFDDRSRLLLLQRDLAALGLAPAPVADPVADLDLPDRAALFGSMYVLEGSALGGKLIARRVHAQWGMGPDNGAAYFHGWGPHTGALWADFRERLAHEVGTSEQEIRSACAAAIATFDALLCCFRQVLGELPAENA